MKEKINEILSASENTMLPGELKAFRKRYTASGFDIQVLREQVAQVEGAYNKFMCLVVALCCMVPQDKEDEINELRAEIERTNRPTTYGGVVMCLKELIAERDLLQVFFDSERARNEESNRTLERTRHNADRLEAENESLHRSQLSHAQQNEQTQGNPRPVGPGHQGRGPARGGNLPPLAVQGRARGDAGRDEAPVPQQEG